MTQNKKNMGNVFPHIFYRTLGANVKKPGSCTLPGRSVRLVESAQKSRNGYATDPMGVGFSKKNA